MSNRPPQSWYWSHDIEPDHIADVLVVPGAHLVRLGAYGQDTHLRFAALLYKEPAPPHQWLVGLDAAALAETLRQSGVQPVSIDTYLDHGVRRYVMVTASGPRTGERHFAIGLRAGDVVGRVAQGRRIVDFTTYAEGGAQKFAVIDEPSAEPSAWIAGVTARDLEKQWTALGAQPVRVRSYAEPGDTEPRYAAVLEHTRGPQRRWYPDLTPSEVARKLDEHRSYPIDLEPRRTPQDQVRFGVVMAAE